MSELIAILGNPALVILFVVLLLIVLAVTVALFGRETVAGWVKAVWHALRGGGANVIAIGLLISLAACAADPFAGTKEAIRKGDGLASTAATAAVETGAAIKTSCLFLDAPEVTLGVDRLASRVGLSKLKERIRERRRRECEDIGGWTWTREVEE